jgi:hypothetical protein
MAGEKMSFDGVCWIEDILYPSNYLFTWIHSEVAISCNSYHVFLCTESQLALES